jgi:hypothetical protein
MHELWGVTSYRRRNKFLSTAGIPALVQQLEPEERGPLEERIAAVTEQYDRLAKQYHTEKQEKGGGKIVFD